ncbi:MAG: TonB-dependent receptor [Chitinophagaceae bacterium]
MRLSTLPILFLLMIYGSFAISQSNTGIIHGSVGTQSGVVPQGATVNLLNIKDSSLVKATIADKDGRYQFNGVPSGSYLVAITASEFTKTFSDPLELTIDKPSANVKPILLSTLVKSLNAITVTAKRSPVEQKIDRLVVNVDAAITNAGANALEVLEKSPGIAVDKDGNISLKGKDGVVVLVDGRQTYLSATDLASYLRTINASQLDQIEIMTNPPAKFDASGNSGVINIKTKKNKQVGYTGSLTVGYGQSVYPKLNDGLNFNYRKNKINLFTNIAHNFSQNSNLLSIQRNFRNKESKDILSRFEQDAESKGTSKNYNGKIGLDYFPSKNTTFGVVLSGFNSSRKGINNNLTHITDATDGEESLSTAVLDGRQKWKNIGTNINFRRVLDTLGSELTADIDYSQYNSTNNTFMVNAYFDHSGLPTLKADTLLGSLPQDIKIYSAKADYTKMLTKGGRFEAGLKASYVKTNNDAAYDSISYGKSVHDFNRSNYFIYEENINAAYANLNQPINKKWGAQLGLRLENTMAKGTQMTTGEKFDRNYTQLFPTAFVQYQFDKKNTYVLNYGRRIRRPDYQSLNPFINFVDRYTYSKGNPNLKPQFSHNLELSHAYQSFLTTTINYSLTSDIIQNVLQQDEVKSETYITKENIAKQRQLGISFNTNIPVTKWWRSNIYANFYNNKYDGRVNDTSISMSATSFQLNGSQQFDFAKTWSVELSGFFRSGGVEGVLQTKPMGVMSFGISKQVLKNAGTIRLNTRDIFYTQRFRAVSKYGNVDAAFQERQDSRTVTLGFTYRFSKGKENNAPKRRSSGSSDEQNRVGG